MADDERRAEIEAEGFKAALAVVQPRCDPVFADEAGHFTRQVLTAYLDRVRDARGDDDACPDCWGGRPKWAGTMPAPPCPTCDGTGKVGGTEPDTASVEDELVRWEALADENRRRAERAEADMAKLVDRLATTTECLRIYLDHRDRGVGIRDGWLEEEVAANDRLLAGFSVDAEKAK